MFSQHSIVIGPFVISKTGLTESSAIRNPAPAVVMQLSPDGEVAVNVTVSTDASCR